MAMVRTASAGLLGAALVMGGAGVAMAAGTAPTRTSLTASPTTVVAGQVAYLRAAVKPVATGTAPSGSVTFLDGGVVLGSAPLVTNAAGIQVAQLSHQFPAGAQSLSAQFAGDAQYAGSTSLPVTEQVGKAGTTTNVTEAAATVKGKYTLVANEKAVEPKGTPTGSITPSGTATFTVDHFAPQAVALGSTGRGHLTLALPVGKHTVSVSYSGDRNFTASSGTLAFTTK